MRHYLNWTVFWCAVRGKHKGRIGFLDGDSPIHNRVFWICDSCGTVER